MNYPLWGNRSFCVSFYRCNKLIHIHYLEIYIFTIYAQIILRVYVGWKNNSKQNKISEEERVTGYLNSKNFKGYHHDHLDLGWENIIRYPCGVFGSRKKRQIPNDSSAEFKTLGRHYSFIILSVVLTQDHQDTPIHF